MIKPIVFIVYLFVFCQTGWSQGKLPSKALKTQSTEAVIKNELGIILEKYRNEKSVESVWKQIRQETDDILFGYYQKGKLVGTTKSQAYFIKIGLETMTSTDIKNQKKILLVGIAIQKPGEFVIIRIEK
jgi:hypothetical protein